MKRPTTRAVRLKRIKKELAKLWSLAVRHRANCYQKLRDKCSNTEIELIKERGKYLDKCGQSFEAEAKLAKYESLGLIGIAELEQKNAALTAEAERLREWEREARIALNIAEAEGNRLHVARNGF